MRITNSRIFRWAREHTKTVAALTAGVVVGAGTATAFAVIPDANGVIHACYTTNTTGLLARVRIIDSPSQNCNANETAISWNQQGPAGPQGPQGPTGPQGPAGDSADVAHGYLVYDANTDTTTVVNSKNVTNAVQRLDVDAGNRPGLSVTVSFAPKNAQVTPFGNNQALQADVRLSDGTWLSRGSSGTDPCADVTGANVWVGGSSGKFFLVH